MRLSCWNCELHDAVVCVRRSSCERVTDKEELVGRLSFASRFPQYLVAIRSRAWIGWCQTYLITAMLTGAKVLARYTVPSAIGVGQGSRLEKVRFLDLNAGSALSVVGIRKACKQLQSGS